jgi:hypothetical protein
VLGWVAGPGDCSHRCSFSWWWGCTIEPAAAITTGVDGVTAIRAATAIAIVIGVAAAFRCAVEALPDGGVLIWVKVVWCNVLGSQRFLGPGEQLVRRGWGSASRGPVEGGGSK